MTSFLGVKAPLDPLDEKITEKVKATQFCKLEDDLTSLLLQHFLEAKTMRNASYLAM